MKNYSRKSKTVLPRNVWEKYRLSLCQMKSTRQQPRRDMQKGKKRQALDTAAALQQSKHAPA
jgi:hypothetical protein